MKKKPKIAIVAGGSGGHIFPAISLLEQLISEKKQAIFFSDIRVNYILNKNRNLFKKKTVKFFSLNITRQFKDFFHLFKNFFIIYKILKKENPNIILDLAVILPFLF